MASETPKIISVQEAFSFSNLNIPDYQRPYKWQEKNIKQLIDDIIYNKDINDYRLGTIVLHTENQKLNIVDGQQRMLTFTLINLALQELYDNEGFYKKFKNINSPLSNVNFDNLITQNNLNENYKIILREIKSFDESTINFFYNHCKVVWVEID